MKNVITSCLTAALLLALTACATGISSTSSSSSAGGSGTTIIPPVFAQTTYSNSSLSGTYSASWWMFNSPAITSYYSALGVLKFDGAGNITSGTITVDNTDPISPCKFDATGTYSIDSTAAGTASLTLVPIAPSSCKTGDTWKLLIAAADSGAAIQMARTDQIGNGSANKQ